MDTQQTSTAPTLSNTAAASLLTSSCPVHRAVMPALPIGSHPNIIYLSERGGLQIGMKDAQLIRYDIITKSKTILLSLVQSGEEISDAQLSTDGQMLQTLFCAPATEIGNIRWSPDSRRVAFAVSAPNGQISTIKVLDPKTAQQEVFTASNYRPYAWLDDTRLYVIKPQGNLLTSLQNLSLLDASQDQAVMVLHPINSQTLLLYIENTSGNLSQNGLWKINADGSSPTRVTNVVGQQCNDLEYPAFYAQIVSSGQYYALRTTNFTSLNESLLVGSLDGNAPATFEMKDTREGVLILVGMVIR